MKAIRFFVSAWILNGLLNHKRYEKYDLDTAKGLMVQDSIHLTKLLEEGIYVNDTSKN